MRINLILLFLLAPSMVSANNNTTCMESEYLYGFGEEVLKEEKEPETCDKHGAAEIELLVKEFESVEGLHRVSKDCTDAKINVVFVHGVDGGSVQTFYAGEQSEVGYWPKHLGDENPSYCVWTLQYTARKFDFPWSPRRTINLMAKSDWFAKRLVSNKIREKPIVFVAHSLGGVIVKQMLQLSWYASDEWLPIWLQTQTVMFLATPHAGSSLADMCLKIENVLSIHRGWKERLTTPALQQLTENNVPLRFLKDWYQKYAPLQDIKTIAFAEDSKLFGVAVIVDEGSADPQVPGVSLSSLCDSTHLSICKPEKTTSEVYHELSVSLQDIEQRLDQGEITELKDQTMLNKETMASLAKIRAWVKDIRGYWWEKVTTSTETHICFVHVKPDHRTNSLVLVGKTWNGNGTHVADWRTLMARVDLVDTQIELKYDWRGEPKGSSAKYFGYGMIRFKDPVGGKINRGGGYFWNVNKDHLETSERRDTDVHRMRNAASIKTMREGSEADQSSCASSTLANWTYYDGTQECLKHSSSH